MSLELHGLCPVYYVPQGRGGDSPNACQVLYPFRRLSQGWSGDSFSLLSRSAPRFPCVENPPRRFLQLFITVRASSASCRKSGPAAHPTSANARAPSAVRRKSRAVFSSAFYYGPRSVCLVLEIQPVGSFSFLLRSAPRFPCVENPVRRFLQLFITACAPFASCWKSGPAAHPAPANACAPSAVFRKVGPAAHSDARQCPHLVLLMSKAQIWRLILSSPMPASRPPRAARPGRRFTQYLPMSGPCPPHAESPNPWPIPPPPMPAPRPLRAEIPNPRPIPPPPMPATRPPRAEIPNPRPIPPR